MLKTLQDELDAKTTRCKELEEERIHINVRLLHNKYSISNIQLVVHAFYDLPYNVCADHNIMILSQNIMQLSNYTSLDKYINMACVSLKYYLTYFGGFKAHGQ